MESFYKTLKYEEVNFCEYEAFEDVMERLRYFIEEVYNLKRLHSVVDYAHRIGNLENAIHWVRELGLSEENTNKILGGNAVRIFGL